MNNNIVCIGAGYIGGPQTPEGEAAVAEIASIYAGKDGCWVPRERILNEEHVRISITDPKALPNAKRDLADICREGLAAPAPLFAEDPYEAAKDADAVLLMTDWKLYPSLDWARIFASMRKPALVFDTRNCLDGEKLRAIGFKVLNVGK